MKSANEILLTALKAISSYVKNFKPTTADALRAQLMVIDDIALQAVDEAEEAKEKHRRVQFPTTDD